MGRYAAEMLPKATWRRSGPAAAGRDFAVVARRFQGHDLPGCRQQEEGYCHPGHDPKMKVNEEALYVGSATYAQCAVRYLEENC